MQEDWVLCRVLNRSKGKNENENACIATSAISNDPYSHHQIPTSSIADQILCSKREEDDDYGFLFDMSFNDSNAVPLNFAEYMGCFDDNDNNTVFV
ncbi:hypothetical protein ACJIZ3_011854 [Penstemon smallii]|uniref:Uncharacterized protein n=1 Tax=Penstemon smallii TaxID=265156 RepID=A0ABD3ULK6_9LAMI